MAQNITQPTDASVGAFLDAVEHRVRRRDGWRLHDLFGQVTGTEAVMWGSMIVGFGVYAYRYGSGRTGTAPRAERPALHDPDGALTARWAPRRCSRAAVRAAPVSR